MTFIEVHPDMWLKLLQKTFPPHYFLSTILIYKFYKACHSGILSPYLDKRCRLWFPKGSYNKNKNKFPKEL